MTTLRDDQVRRYSRHVLLPDVGGVGQKRLLAGAVTLDVLDDAGQAAALYLAAAGVGRLIVRDARSVFAPGPLFEVGDVGQARLAAARVRVALLNPDCVVEGGGAGEGGGGNAVALAIAPAADAVAAMAAGTAAARRALRALVAGTAP